MSGKYGFDKGIDLPPVPPKAKPKPAPAAAAVTVSPGTSAGSSTKGHETPPEAIEAMMRPEESPFACIGPGDAKYGNNPGWIENPHLRTGTIPDDDLDAELDFLPQKDVFLSTEVKAMAHILGY